MADYYTSTQLATRLGVAEHILEELVSKELLQPKLKGESRFFSSSQAHDVEVAYRLSQKRKIGLDRAMLLVREMRERHYTNK